MIVRILGEGQYELPDTERSRLDDLDARIDAAVDSGDDASFRAALADVIKVVRSAGTPVDPARIVPSDFALPGPDANLDEVRALLESGAPADS